MAAHQVIIVGGGVLGCALAAELLSRGHAVTLLEKAVPGAEASSAAAGILAPQAECDEDGPLLDLCLFGARRTAEVAREIVDETGIDVALDRTGLVHAAFAEHEVAHLAARVAWQRALGLRAELVDGAAARALVPALAGDAISAAYFPDDHHLDTRLYGAGLAALAKKRGAVVKTGAVVQRVVVADGRCTGVEIDAALLPADAVVVCAGAWSSRVPGAGLAADAVFPVRGQIALLQGPPGLFTRTLWGAGGYLVPRRDGRVICGSTMERAGFDKSVTAAGIRHVLHVAMTLVPALRDAALADTWSGLRPGTQDGGPLLGRVADGLFVNTGHFRNGILLAAASAVVVADLLAGRAPPVDVSSFAPSRAA